MILITIWQSFSQDREGIMTSTCKMELILFHSRFDTYQNFHCLSQRADEEDNQ